MAWGPGASLSLNRSMMDPCGGLQEETLAGCSATVADACTDPVALVPELNRGGEKASAPEAELL